MGHCSNRPDTQEEKISKWAKEISQNTAFISGRSESAYEDFHSTTGARIRGEMGIEKGNKFIEAIKEANRR
jgi:hypothetical protein